MPQHVGKHEAEVLLSVCLRILNTWNDAKQSSSKKCILVCLPAQGFPKHIVPTYVCEATVTCASIYFLCCHLPFQEIRC